jgi:hypothetical protein
MTIASDSSPDRLFVSPETRVTCPECEHEFSLAQGFAKRALEGIEQASADALRDLRGQERAEVERRIENVARERTRGFEQQIAELKDLMAEQARQNHDTHAQVLQGEREAAAAQLHDLRQVLKQKDLSLAALQDREGALATRERELETRVSAAAKLQAEQLIARERADFERRLAEQSEQVRLLREHELELRRDKAAVQDRAAGLEVEVLRKFDAERAGVEAKVRAQEQERAAFDKAELQKKLDDASAQLAAAQRRMEQGSQQLQGEILELAVEELLRRSFPLDTLEEVKKGARGGDLIHRVVTRSAQSAGTILWETKRAKEWSPQWVAKLKEDMRACGADVGVIVTTATPKEFDSLQIFGLHEEIWVTGWTAAVPLAECLRGGLLDVHKQRLVSDGKGENMEALYDYLTSVQFAQKFRAVYDSFRIMNRELERERTATEQRWARREKQIALAMKELVGIAGSIQGLSQQELPQLELQAEDDPEL